MIRPALGLSTGEKEEEEMILNDGRVKGEVLEGDCVLAPKAVKGTGCNQQKSTRQMLRPRLTTEADPEESDV